MKGKYMATKKQPSSLLNIGASPESVKAVQHAITDILKLSHVDGWLKAEALRALNKGCAVENVTISNNTFSNN
jgi:hypothetical protein